MNKSISSVIVLTVLVVGCGAPQSKHGVPRCVLDGPADAPAAVSLDSTIQSLADHLKANGVQCSISGYDSRWLYVQSDHKRARNSILDKMKGTAFTVRSVDWDFAEPGAEGEAANRAP